MQLLDGTPSALYTPVPPAPRSTSTSSRIRLDSLARRRAVYLLASSILVINHPDRMRRPSLHIAMYVHGSTDLAATAAWCRGRIVVVVILLRCWLGVLPPRETGVCACGARGGGGGGFVSEHAEGEVREGYAAED